MMKTAPSFFNWSPLSDPIPKFYFFVQGPGYFRLKNFFYKDSIFTAKLENVFKEIVISTAANFNLDLDCNINALEPT